MKFFTKYIDNSEDVTRYQELIEEQTKEITQLRKELDEEKIRCEAKHKTLRNLERIIRRGTTQASREDIRKLTLEEIEGLIKEATQNLLALKTVKGHYNPYSRHMALGRKWEKDRETIVMETIIGEMEEYIENLTREKYRKILDAEEKGGNEQ